MSHVFGDLRLLKPVFVSRDLQLSFCRVTEGLAALLGGLDNIPDVGTNLRAGMGTLLIVMRTFNRYVEKMLGEFPDP
jgi:hypothetical protein